MANVCKGICGPYIVPRNPLVSPYEDGIKRCSLCVIWIRWDGKFCPCCKLPLRNRPRFAAAKRRWVRQNIKYVDEDIQENPDDYYKEDDD